MANKQVASVDVATFRDKYGDAQTIHRTRHGLRVKQGRSTPILYMNPVIGELVGKRITALREERGYTLKELADRMGLTSGKNRMWEIEKGTRGEGLRFGTLYAAAMALGVEVEELLPSVEEVRGEANIREITVPRIS